MYIHVLLFLNESFMKSNDDVWLNPQINYFYSNIYISGTVVVHHAEVTSDRTSLSPFTKETRGAAS